MLTYIDSANPKEIEEIAKWGCISGITTNPKIMENAKQGLDREDLLAEIITVAKTRGISHVSVELISDRELWRLKAEAQQLASLDESIVIKVPMYSDGLGLRLISELRDLDIRTNATCLMSFNQVALATQAGADYVSLFYRRIIDYYKTTKCEDPETHALTTVVYSAAFVDTTNKSNVRLDSGQRTQLICGSIRMPVDVENCRLAGSHIVTVPYKFFSELIKHPKTDEAIAEFDEAWKKFVAGVVK